MNVFLACAECKEEYCFSQHQQRQQQTPWANAVLSELALALSISQVEAELVDLEDKNDFLESLRVQSDDCGLRHVIREAYKTLDLQTYFTSGPTETRAWTFKKGWKAPKAAGVIHGDLERGFIQAETISYEDLVECGSEAEMKKQGKLRSEGKDYVVQEGDVILFRFNV
jgi:ribosome-binding ATPase YchF (GTP1/OBG family)